MNVKQSWYRDAFSFLIRPQLLTRKTLRKSDLLADPVAQFSKWYSKAEMCPSLEFPNAMSLATVDPEGWPESRMVLLKSFDKEGFVFYTNLESAKGLSLKDHPKAELNFYWQPLQRQVRVQGVAELVSDKEADEYFESRSRGSKIGAWASEQSRWLPSRETLEERVRKFEKEFQDKDIPRPEYWNGIRVVPRKYEFWQLRLSRLHDRFVYTIGEEGDWVITRLSP